MLGPLSLGLKHWNIAEREHMKHGTAITLRKLYFDRLYIKSNEY